LLAHRLTTLLLLEALVEVQGVVAVEVLAVIAHLLEQVAVAHLLKQNLG
jgi:hypothetical protein